MEFGPKLRINRYVRLKSKFRGVSSSQIEKWINEFKSVEDTLWDYADKLYRGELSKSELEHELEGKFRTLDRKSLKLCASRTMYYKFKL